MNSTCVSTSSVQVAVERTIHIQPLLFEKAVRRCGVELVYHWYGLDKDLGSVLTIRDEVCKSGFVG